MKNIIKKIASKYKKKKELKSKDDENFARLTEKEGQARVGYSGAIKDVKASLYPKREKKHREATYLKPKMEKVSTEKGKGSKEYKWLKKQKKRMPQADIRDIVRDVARGKKEDAFQAELNVKRERLGMKKKKTTGWKK